MKQLIAIIVILLVGVFFTTVATADDVDDVKAAVYALYETLNKGDADGFAKLVWPGGSFFSGNGGLIFHYDTSVKNIKSNMQALFDTGWKVEGRIYHLDVKVYGNTAVTTHYHTEQEQVINRGSMVWIKTGGQWKRVHGHVSRLITASPE